MLVGGKTSFAEKMRSAAILIASCQWLGRWPDQTPVRFSVALRSA